MHLDFSINIAYILAAVFFVMGLKMLSSPDSARQGNMVSAFGMLVAVAATLLTRGLSFQWITLGIGLGVLVGILVARLIAMTAMPEMVALLNGFGGIASLLVAWAVYHQNGLFGVMTTTTLFLSVVIGGVTFTGSLVAWGKLSGKINGKPILFKGQKIINILTLVSILATGVWLIFSFNGYPVFLFIIILSFILGILSVIPIGGADMPVVISLLNSYSGLAACAAGFVIQNNILIVAGSLVGASGIILTQIMCKAMNRSLSNVLFSGFGSRSLSLKSAIQGEPKPISIEDAYFILEAAKTVIIVPGYGLAVARAQHVLKELGELLENNGCEIKYAIHPVAGRMPGHMNVLLAEANISYDQLAEMEEINPKMSHADVCIVLGANDVVNPSAIHDSSSPIYGMPIIEAHKAKTVFILKRSMAAGFAGIPNQLFYYENTRMLFGDAKASLQGLISEFKQT